MLRIIDTTLRDGEQAPGVAFTVREKVNIARLLDWLGVYQIEAGIPVMGDLEQKAIRAIARSNLKARVSAWNRLLLADIRASLACGVKDIHISCPASELQIRYKLGRSRMWVLDCLKRAIRYASDYGCRVTVGAEDATRADASFLLDLALLAQEMGAERLRYCDTMGVLNPFTTVERLEWLRSKLSLEIEFHGHNDFGMATANTLAAIKAGIRYVDTTVGGLGERAGNASLEELSAALQGIYGYDPGLNSRVLPVLSRHVARAARRPVSLPRRRILEPLPHSVVGW
jgi:homocitrate synthase NifV